MLAVFLLSMACVSAGEMDDAVATEDTNAAELSANNDIIEDNLQTSENDEVTLTGNDETLSAINDTEVLGDNPGTYSMLSSEIGSGGNIELQHDYYAYDAGDTISISVADSVIDGKGAVIDMAGSNIRAFNVTTSGVTIKNLTIKNANCNGEGGAIYFNSSGTVTNCNFINITSTNSGGAVFIYDQGTVTNCNFTGNKATGDYSHGGAVFIYDQGTVTNCNFIDNTATSDSGAVYFWRIGTVTNCNFTGNKATGESGLGGAVYFKRDGTVTNCNFTNNTATSEGGAVCFWSIGNVTNCNFTGNNATTGSAIYFYNAHANKTVSNSRFFNNRANAKALEIIKYDINIEITFTGINNFLNAIYSDGEVTFTNVEYWGANGITTVSDTMSGSSKAAGQNITVVVFNGSLVLNEVKVTDADGRIALNIDVGDNYYIGARHDTDSYYTEAEKAISYMAFNVNVTSQTTTNKTVNITAKSNIYSEFMLGKLLFILPNGTQISANHGANGTWWAIHTFDACGEYEVNATYVGLNNVIITNANISISKTPTNISVLNDTIVLEVLDEVAAGASLTPADVGNVTYTVSNSSVVKVENDKIIAVGEGNAVITVSFAGNEDYIAAENKTISVTVKLNNAGVSVNNKTLDLLIGDEFSVVVTTVPEGLDVTFTPDNFGIVSVDENGLITALKEGNATVKVSVGGDGVYALNTTDVTVAVSKVPTEIILNNATLDMNVGDVFEGVAGLKPVTGDNLTYTSSNPSVVKVENGKIIAVGEGSTNITVSFAGDDKYVAAENKTISVTVKLNNAGVSVNNKTLDLLIGDEFSVVVTTAPEGLDVTFTPDNSGIVSVDENGIVTALKEGNATVKVSVGGDGVYALNTTEVSVTVKKIPTEIIANSILNMCVGDVARDIAGLKPVAEGNLTYTSSNPSVVKVENGKIIAVGEGSTNITVSFAGDDKYVAAENKTISVTVKLNDASVSVNKATLDLLIKDTFNLAATTVPEGLNVSYSSTNESVVNVDSKGIVTAVGTGKATIVVTVGDDKVYAINSTNVTVTVKQATLITAADVSTTYNINKNLVITLKDGNGKALTNVKLTVVLNGAKTYTIDKNGQVKVSSKGLAPKKYTAKVTFNGDSVYGKSSKDIKVTVKKATPKLTAKKKTFKRSVKVKKYSIVLKNNVGKAIKKAKVTIKIGKKTYTAKTNSKGKATFKIKKLIKKGKYKAKISYKGNKYYNKVTKKVNIRIK